MAWRSLLLGVLVAAVAAGSHAARPLLAGPGLLSSSMAQSLAIPSAAHGAAHPSGSLRAQHQHAQHAGLWEQQQAVAMAVAISSQRARLWGQLLRGAQPHSSLGSAPHARARRALGRRLAQLPGLEGTQWWPTPEQWAASLPRLGPNPAEWPRWMLLPVRQQDFAAGKPTKNVAMYLPIMQTWDAAGTKQWYVPFTGLRLGGKDVPSAVLTKILQPSVFALPYEMGNNANSTAVAFSGGAPLIPAVATAVAEANATREFVGRTNATAKAVAEGDVAPFVVADAVALTTNKNLFGQTVANADADASGGVSGAVDATAVSIGQATGAGGVTSTATADAQGAVVPVVNADATAIAQKPGGAVKAKATSSATDVVGGASSSSVAIAAHGPVNRRRLLRGAGGH